MSTFTSAIDAFIAAIRDEQSSVEQFNEHSNNLSGLYSQATPQEIDDALARLAALLPAVPLAALGQLAITCGSLVEYGGKPDIAGTALLGQLDRVNQAASMFYHRCRAMAESDGALVEECRAEAAENAGEDMDAGSLTAADIIDDHIGSYGWQDLAQRFGPALFAQEAAPVLGYMAEEYFRLGLTAHLSRSKPLRQAARAQPGLLRQTLAADEAAGSERSFLAILLQVLDDEPVVVLHVGQRKGFHIRIAGIADNFQLHTLLAGALIGAPAEGMLEGQAPGKQAVAQCRDLATGNNDGENVTGAFNLWNWRGLQADGKLGDNTNQWIWGEGCPADIQPFEERRVILLGPSPYARHWRAGRMFQGMAGELTVERHLSDAEVAHWLGRLASAASS